MRADNLTYTFIPQAYFFLGGAWQKTLQSLILAGQRENRGLLGLPLCTTEGGRLHKTFQAFPTLEVSPSISLARFSYLGQPRSSPQSCFLNKRLHVSEWRCLGASLPLLICLSHKARVAAEILLCLFPCSPGWQIHHKTGTPVTPTL
jgi:hypothetical protein